LASNTFVETFANAPIFTNNWRVQINTGTTIATCTTGNLRLQASRSDPYPPDTRILLVSKDVFIGDVDYYVELNHQGKGRSTIGLWSDNVTNFLASTVLDTDDTDYLAFGAGAFATDWKYAGSPYMNRWITLRIKTVGNQIQFYADGLLLETTSLVMNGGVRLGFGAASVAWKSGDNDTSFRSLTAVGTKQ
jgi:hypothetical protein